MESSQPTPRSDWSWTSHSEADTDRLGGLLAGLLSPGSVIALVGNLGAGKTRLVQAVAEALGVDRRDVCSPTFVLLHEYHGRLTVYHFDACRLADAEEFLALGADELLAGDGVCLIEWADRVSQALPPDHLRVEIEIAGETERLFRLTSGGAQSRETLERLRAALPNAG